MAKEVVNPLLGLNGQVTEEHVTELEAAIADREKELVGLRQLHKLGLALLGKLPERKARQKKAEPVDINTKRKQVARFLSAGIKNGQQVIHNCGVSPTKLAETMDCPWFAKSDQGWYLTPIGRQQV
jgi:hypothetical protein